MTVQSGTLVVTLACQPPNSYPDAAVTWYRSSGDEVTESNALQTPTGSLVIHHVTSDNAGEYYCEAKNTLLDGVKANSGNALLQVTGTNGFIKWEKS